MFSSPKQSKTVIQLTDSEISYLTLKKNKQSFFIDQHESIELPEGIIKQGEILQADVFSKILKKIQKQLENKEVDVLMPHEFFLCNDAVLSPDKKNLSIKKRVKEYFMSLPETEHWQKTHVCEFEDFSFGKNDAVLFTCLPKDVQKSYVHILKKSGLKVRSINSNILAFGHLLVADTSSLVFVEDNETKVVDFKKGMYTGHKKFQFSYQQLIQDIMKNVSMTKEEAQKVLMKHGLLRTHHDVQVYKRMMRSAGPLLDFFKKSKSKNKPHMTIINSHMPLPGFADTLSHMTHSPVNDFNIFSDSRYVFQDILTLHKKESYRYQAHIAQALKFWKK